MALIDTLLNIQISEGTAVTPTASTTIPLILATSARPSSWAPTDVVHTYFAAADVLADGFAETSPEYQAALVLCSQSTVPSEFLIGIRQDVAQSAQSQINTFRNNTVADATPYALTVNGTTYSVTSSTGATAATIAQQLIATINQDANALVVASLYSTSDLVLTAKLAGQALNYTNVTSNLTNDLSYAAKTAESGALDVNDLNLVQAANSTWYGLVLVAATDAEIETAAAWVQAQRKMLFAATAATDNALITALSEASYSRTVVAVSPNNAALIMPAWVGGQLPQTPGSNNWAYKTLVGVTPDTLSLTEQSTILGNPAGGVLGNNANVYLTVGGVPVTLLGTVASGDFIDNQIGIDALFFAMQSGILNVLQSAQKVPMTDAGVAIIEGAVRVALQQATTAGFLVDGWTVSAPKVANWPVAKRRARICPTITFTATLSGAINATNIQGTVSV